METRQQKRKDQRDEFKKQEALRKQYNAPATRGEMYTIIENLNKMRERLFQLDVFCSAVEKVLIEKNVANREEFEAAYKYEAERAKTFNEINNGFLNYEKRLDECQNWKIDPNGTVIPQQLIEDKKLTTEEKLELARKYEIKEVLKQLTTTNVETPVEDSKVIFGEISSEKVKENGGENENV
jgi:hypothetical protein